MISYDNSLNKKQMLLNLVIENSIAPRVLKCVWHKDFCQNTPFLP